MNDDGAATDSRLRRLTRAGLIGVGVAVVLFGVGFVVRSTWDPLQAMDSDAVNGATDITRAHPALLDTLIGWQFVTQPKYLYIVGTLVCLWVWFGLGRRSRAWWAFGTMMVCWFVGYAAKLVVQRARPVIEDPVSEAPGFSFPSGHAMGSAGFAVTMVVLFWPMLRTAWARALAIGAAVLLILGTCLDRVFLGVHYPTDVTVGVITGTGLVLASYAGYIGWSPPTPAD